MTILDRQPDDHPTDPNRNRKGQFARGNQANRKSGLYAELSISPREKKQAYRIRANFRRDGVPELMAGQMALAATLAGRVIEDIANLESAEERLEKFDVFTRASSILTGIAQRFERARRAKTEREGRPGNLAADVAARRRRKGGGPA